VPWANDPVRRAFHTLKAARACRVEGPGEAAWGCEQLYNARMADATPADSDLLDFSAEALTTWAGGSRASPLAIRPSSNRVVGVPMRCATTDAAYPDRQRRQQLLARCGAASCRYRQRLQHPSPRARAALLSLNATDAVTQALLSPTDTVGAACQTIMPRGVSSWTSAPSSRHPFRRRSYDIRHAGGASRTAG
jgi:hypothetical protein